VAYAYDNANRLTQITQGASTVTYTYDAAGRRTSLTLPNNVLIEYVYDSASRLTSITYKQNGATVLGNLTYEYDKNGNRTKTGGSFARTGVPSAVASTAYNAANHQTTFGDKTLTYDNNGNLQTITDPSGATTYTWNARNQLTGISGPGMSASFVYDGLGRREKKTINGTVTEFLYDRLNPVQETSGATILANILPGLGIDGFLTRTDVVAGVTSHFLIDTLGSPVAVTDNAGAVQTEYTYEPFGKTTFSGTSNSSSYQYTGRENDGTGLYYYRNRYYHPQLQRFISEDPIEFGGGGFNRYPYVGNNPLRYIDPFGLCFGKNCDLPPQPNNKSKPPKPIPPDPCKTMDCTKPAPPPSEPCKTPGECFPSHQGDPKGEPQPQPYEPLPCVGCYTDQGTVIDENGEYMGGPGFIPGGGLGGVQNYNPFAGRNTGDRF
jgi:RHS repeat-associated protein